MTPPNDRLRERLTAEFLDKKRRKADPLADSLLDNMVQSKGKIAAMEFFDKMIRNIDLPLEMLHTEDRSVISNLYQLPEWADRDKLRHGEELFIDHGPKFLLFLYFKSLPLLYSMANGAEVLTATGRLTHKEDSMNIFSRRIAETGQFLLDVMCPGGVGGPGTGIPSIIKVRLIHASIRKFVAEGSWNEAKLGKPINQEDLAATLMTFSVSMIDAMDQFGIVNSKEQREGYLHTWKVIGHLLGIDQDLLPADIEEGRQLLASILNRQSAPSEAGVVLTEALIEFSKQHFKSGIISNIPKALIRHLTGDDIASILQVQPKHLWLYELLPGVFRRFFNWIERLEDLSLPMNILVDELSTLTVKGMVAYFNRYKDKRFEVPQTLEDKWQA